MSENPFGEGFDMGALLQQAQAMQEQLMSAQAELAGTTVDGTVGGGLVTAAIVAITPLLFGGAVMESAAWTLHPPLLGTIKLSSVLAFDAGVYLVVVGLVMMMFESFGDDPPPIDDDRRRVQELAREPVS